MGVACHDPRVGRIEPFARFWSTIRVDPETGCWMWIGDLTAPNSHGPGGYGKFFVDGKTVLAHRWAWQTYRGPIPDNLPLDHKGCDRPACVYPGHCEPATHRENILRGCGRGAVNARKTHCIRGHAFTPENTGKHPNGRFCRTCRREADRRYRRERGAA